MYTLVSPKKKAPGFPQWDSRGQIYHTHARKKGETGRVLSWVWAARLFPARAAGQESFG